MTDAELDKLVDSVLVQLLAHGSDIAFRVIVGLVASIVAGGSRANSRERIIILQRIEDEVDETIGRYDGVVEQIREERRAAPPSYGLVRRVRIDPRGPRSVTLDALAEKLLSLTHSNQPNEADAARRAFVKRIEVLLGPP